MSVKFEGRLPHPNFYMRFSPLHYVFEVLTNVSSSMSMETYVNTSKKQCNGENTCKKGMWQLGFKVGVCDFLYFRNFAKSANKWMIRTSTPQPKMSLSSLERKMNLHLKIKFPTKMLTLIQSLSWI